MKFFTTVTRRVEVTLDETKFTEEMMRDFGREFYPFHDIDRHAEYIGELAAREIIPTGDQDFFIACYGHAKEMGISARINSTETESRRA